MPVVCPTDKITINAKSNPKSVDTARQMAAVLHHVAPHKRVYLRERQVQLSVDL